MTTAAEPFICKIFYHQTICAVDFADREDLQASHGLGLGDDEVPCMGPIPGS